MNHFAAVRLGLILAVVVSASLFTALVAALIVLRAGAGLSWVFPDPNIHLLISGLMVVVLAIGSFMLETARKCLRRGGLIGLRATLLNASAKGLAWLLLLALEIYLLAGGGFVPAQSTFAALYYFAGGMLALHVIAVMCVLVPMAVRPCLPGADLLRNVTLFWHYLTVLSVVVTVAFHLA